MPPQDVCELVEKAFGPGVVLAPLSGGRSGAELFTFEAAGAAYVVRKMSGPALAADKAHRELACMTIAAELGVAPRVVRADPERGIVIMTKITGTPISRGTPRDTDPFGRIARTLRILHGGPAFPPGPNMVDMFRQLAAGLPPALVTNVEAIAPVLARGPSAPCHRDLNPTNIFATADRVYLIDWEVAGESDPLFDLAQLGIWICRDDAERAVLLERYLERAPEPAEQHRQQLNRALALGFYSAAFHLVCMMQGRTVSPPGPTLEGLFAAMAATGQPFAPEDMAAALLAEHLREAAAL